MSRTIRAERADEGITKQIQIADRVQNLVLHKFIVIAQTVFVQHPKVVENDCVVEPAATGKSRLLQRFHVRDEAEGARPTDLFHE